MAEARKKPLPFGGKNPEACRWVQPRSGQALPFILHIRRFREARRLSQPGLAAAAGLANKRIWNLEHARCDPRLSDLYALARTLGCTVEELHEERPCTTPPEEKAP